MLGDVLTSVEPITLRTPKRPAALRLAGGVALLLVTLALFTASALRAPVRDTPYVTLACMGLAAAGGGGVLSGRRRPYTCRLDGHGVRFTYLFGREVEIPWDKVLSWKCSALLTIRYRRDAATRTETFHFAPGQDPESELKEHRAVRALLTKTKPEGAPPPTASGRHRKPI